MFPNEPKANEPSPSRARAELPKKRAEPSQNRAEPGSVPPLQKSEAAHLFRVVAVALFEFTTKLGVSVHIDVSLDFSRWHMCARVLKGFHIRV